MPKQPLAEVFGFPVTNDSVEATRYRENRLCPYNNRIPNCTKDKVDNPLGVCSIFESQQTVITCPIRFRQDWIIAADAAKFFFPEGTRWTSLSEVRLEDKFGRAAGNIDLVLVSYNETGQVLNFGALEVQAVYISGNVRHPFENFMAQREDTEEFTWLYQKNYPRPDYLSSSRKRLAPQLIYKGGILKSWNKKMAVVVDRGFYSSLPELPLSSAISGDIGWFVYELERNEATNRFHLVQRKIEYTDFEPALEAITKTQAGSVEAFLAHLQVRLSQKLDHIQPQTSDMINDHGTEE